ncbi:thioredoxin-like protein [Camillea tinctor]|nr:thioredoxin-like protein [Camillea tinctor]
MASAIKRLFTFKRKKAPPLACHLTLDEDENHVHTAACFLEVQPLAVAEFFQSQGCASCPPAVPGILDATNHPNLHLLTYNVTYFDHLGHRDPYASPRWDQRQKAYVRRWGRNSLYTPMVVVGGVADGGSGGGSRDEIDGVVGRAREALRQVGEDWHIYVDVNESGVRIDSDRLEAEAHDVLAVVYEDRSEMVKIPKGPNKGKKVMHKNVVKDIVKIGEWAGGNVVLAPLPQMAPGTAAVVLVQAPMGGPVVAVCKMS